MIKNVKKVLNLKAFSIQKIETLSHYAQNNSKFMIMDRIYQNSKIFTVDFLKN